jgi:hypothetical protein
MYNNAPQNNQQANQAPNPLIDQLLNQVGQGQFPWLNRWEGVVQVFPTQNAPNGFVWRNGNNGNEGHVVISGKIRKAWGGRSPGVKQSKIRIKCYGQMGQWLSNNLQPGMLIYVKGEVICVRFQNNQGQWVDDTHVQIKEAKQGDVTFHMLGMMQVLDESNQQQNNQNQGNGGGYRNNNNGGNGGNRGGRGNGGNGGYGNSMPQNNYNQGGGGYQNQSGQQGGYQANQGNGGANGGGYGQAPQGRPQQGQPQGGYTNPAPANQGNQGGYGGQARAPGNAGGVQQGQAPQGPVNQEGQAAGSFAPAQNSPTQSAAAAPASGPQFNDAPPIDNDDIPF